MTVNKKNQTLEIKDIFGWNKTLTIPFEIKDKKFVLIYDPDPDWDDEDDDENDVIDPEPVDKREKVKV